MTEFDPAARTAEWKVSRRIGRLIYLQWHLASTKEKPSDDDNMMGLFRLIEALTDRRLSRLLEDRAASLRDRDAPENPTADKSTD